MPAQLIHFFSIEHEQGVIMDFAFGLSHHIYSLLIGIYHPSDFFFPLERSFMSNSCIHIHILLLKLEKWTTSMY